MTEELDKKFNKVIGTDPSAKMLSAVHVPAAIDGKPPIEYKVASAEDLSFIESNSVDMVTAGQAAHWFKQDKSFPEIARILKPGGTLAFFCILYYSVTMLTIGYGDVSFGGHPELSPLLRHYMYGRNTLGPYWEEPGRSIVVNLYRDIIPPDELYKDVTRHFFPRDSGSGERENIVQIPGKMSIEGTLRPYGKTWSSYHGWLNAFPDKKSRENGGSGDILDDMLDALKDTTGWGETTEFDLEWISGILLARKRDL